MNQNKYYNTGKQNFTGQYYQPPQITNTNVADGLNPYMLAKAEKQKQKRELKKIGLAIGVTIIAYLVVQVIAVYVLKALGLSNLNSTSPIFSNCFTIFAVHICSLLVPFGILAFVFRKKYEGPIIPAAKTSGVTVFSWLCVGMAWTLVSNILVNIVINIFKEFGYELTQGTKLDPDSALACVVLVISTAIVPGVIEEFALRCCTLGILKRYGAGFGVFSVSVVFGLLHGNVIQFIYAFLVGLLLAYITINTGSVVPAMLIHACSNGMSVVQDILTYASGEDFANKVMPYIMFSWFVLAIFGVLYLFIKKEMLPKKQLFAKAKNDMLSFGEKLVCLIPGFFVPFALLLLLTANTIHKI